jgi:hypothetical protein
MKSHPELYSIHMEECPRESGGILCFRVRAMEAGPANGAPKAFIFVDWQGFRLDQTFSGVEESPCICLHSVLKRRPSDNLFYQRGISMSAVRRGHSMQKTELSMASAKGLTAFLLILMWVTAGYAASTEKTVYSFAGGSSDGSYPGTTLVADKNYNLYGTTDSGGSHGNCSPFGESCGVIYELKRSGANFTESVIYQFTGETDGGLPYGSLIIDAKGNLYGTAYLGGNQYSCAGGPCGVVYELSQVNGAWQETVLHDFGAAGDGMYPQAGLVMDKQGNLYGTTNVGGISGACNTDGFAGYGCGTVFELSPSGNGTWTETVLYAFTGGADGAFPYSSLVIDKAGNVYGTTNSFGSTFGSGCDGYGCGTAFELTKSESGWTLNTIYEFTGNADGGNPVAGMILDSAGNLYGTTSSFSQYYYGAVFQLHPANGGWTENTLYTFTGGADGGTPDAPLVGRGTTLYGTTSGGGTGTGCGLFGAYPCGVIFSLTPGSGGWTENVIYSFTGGDDGGEPQTSVTFAPNGKILGGAALIGGEHGLGTIYEITP